MMFTRGFAQMLAASAHGNPIVLGAPIIWAARIVSQHAQLADAAFAAVQLLLAVGIAWPRTTRLALACSIAWALAVWWFGEGLGGLFAGSANLANGAPGAALLYALAAVLLWPVEERERRPASFVASRPLGTARARALWLLLWLTIAVMAAHSSAAMIGPVQGQPPWLAWLDHRAAALLAHDRMAISLALAALCGTVALAVFLPSTPMRLLLGAALLAIALIWVVAQDFGGILSGSATDPSSGPLLALLVLAYWPQRRCGERRAGRFGMRDHTAVPGVRPAVR